MRLLSIFLYDLASWTFELWGNLRRYGTGYETSTYIKTPEIGWESGLVVFD